MSRIAKLAPGKSIVRETLVLERGVPWILDASGRRFTFHLKGERQFFDIEIADVIADAKRRAARAAARGG